MFAKLGDTLYVHVLLSTVRVYISLYTCISIQDIPMSSEEETGLNVTGESYEETDALNVTGESFEETDGLNVTGESFEETDGLNVTIESTGDDGSLYVPTPKEWWERICVL